MALDGAFLSQLKKEIENQAIGGRIEKINQPSREVLILTMRWHKGGGKLLLCAAPEGPRIHFTNQAPENPKAPPMFCMLLRKHLTGAKLLSVSQMGLDRVLHLEFEARSELGDIEKITVVIEIMGRHSNIILVHEDGRILDSIKRVGIETSSVRQVLPGLEYANPPAQDKLDITAHRPPDIMSRLRAGKDIELSKGLMEVLEGFSPLLCREVAYYVTGGVETIISQLLSPSQIDRLLFYLDRISKTIQSGDISPVMILEPSGRPRDFSFIDIRQYGLSMVTKGYKNLSELLDSFYSDRDRVERVRQRSGDLLKLLSNTTDRISRKLAAQREELKVCADRDKYKINGDILSANLYSIKKGDNSARVENFYDPNGELIDIELDTTLSPAENAQRYYGLYRKASTAEKMLIKLIEQGKSELAYLDSVFDVLTRADGEGDLDAIRQELAQEGYVKRSGKPGAQKEQKLPPLRFYTGDGVLISVGRNNLQNDHLTLKEAHKDDIWLHTQKIPGSHVIISAHKGNVSGETIELAATLAAYHSKARTSSKVPVDFALVRHVKKPSGAKPGMVIYDSFKTVIVDPCDDQLIITLSDVQHKKH